MLADNFDTNIRYGLSIYRDTKDERGPGLSWLMKEFSMTTSTSGPTPAGEIIPSTSCSAWRNGY